MPTKGHTFFEFKDGEKGLTLQVAGYIGAVGAFLLAGFALALRNGLLSLMAALIFLFSLHALLLVSSKSRRLRTRIITDLPAFREYLKQSNRLLVLLLREFASDGAFDSSHESYWTAEEDIVGQVRRYGVLLAVGKPGERLPPGGGYRLYLREEDWQRDVLDLIDRADAIVYRCGQTTALQWELKQIVERRKFERTVFVTTDIKSNLETCSRIRELTPINFQVESLREGVRILRDAVRENDAQGGSRFSPKQLEDLYLFERNIEKHEMIAVTARGSVFIVADGVVKPLSGPLSLSVREGLELIGLKRSSRGLIDKENPWQFENFISVLSVVGIGLSFLLMIMALVLYPLFQYLEFGAGVNFIEATFVYFLFAGCALFLLSLLVRP